MIADYMRQIAYNEGWEAYTDGVLCIDNPYEGVSDELFYLWDDGWWDAFYEDEEKRLTSVKIRAII